MSNNASHECRDDEVFVFGSNLNGLHAGGAAKFALDHKGAIWGQAYGRQGDSYAIPTKREFSQSLEVWQVKVYVDFFLEHARQMPGNRFFVTRVGCGLAGFTDAQITPMFRQAPQNCRLPPEWAPWL